MRESSTPTGPQIKRQRLSHVQIDSSPPNLSKLLSTSAAHRLPMSASRMARGGRNMRPRPVTSYAEPEGSVAEPTSPAFNFRGETGSAADTLDEGDLGWGDTIHAIPRGTLSNTDEGSSKRRKRALAMSPTRQMPARSTRSTVIYASPKRLRRSSRQILASDVKPDLSPPKSAPPKSAPPKANTARMRVRQDIAERTKPRRDAFLVAHASYFRPLLPPSNYIAKLERRYDDDEAMPDAISHNTLVSQPEGVKADMKPYQLEGLNFLVKMYQNGMSAILGDEMGLGKTLQTLSLFQWLHENEPAEGEIRPFLVVCPLSVLSSWISEVRKWVPHMEVIRFHGPKSERERLKADMQTMTGRAVRNSFKIARHSTGKSTSATNSQSSRSVDIVVTTYETFLAEQTWFKRVFVWRYVVLDEGHKIKNENSEISSVLQGMSAEYRLLLTGTPIQNNLKEMWALLHWLYPEVFSAETADLFRTSFDLTAGKVSTEFMDNARRMLEVIMLRRMKNSPGVNLGLPPREEVLLFVPLTPMQRFWYTRLLTRMDQATLEEVFKGARIKEDLNIAKIKEEDSTLLEDTTDGAKTANNDDVWAESKAIMQQAIQQENVDKSNRQWTKLMNLVMQLRKACSHPYLLPGAYPEPYELGNHVRTNSGKFIVLDKLVAELVLKQRKKVLIFSGFTRTLDLCEDLLTLKGANAKDAPFRYMRLDGGTHRAKRNLGIRMFNDSASNFRVMLISTRAGGLGINLASASDVVFLDEDWNPQITLQAEARAHRIGQTQKVTIYKLCTRGTVEEQMMGRIRKKLYLSAKITESMRNVHTADFQKKMKGKEDLGDETSADDGPQLGTSQLMTLLRRGAQTLSSPEVDVTEMLGWDWETTLKTCRDRPQDPCLDTTAKDTAQVDEQAWLNQVERVETAVFEGKKHHRKLDQAIKNRSVDLSRADRRAGKNTTVMVNGFAISKESMQCGDWEAVPTLAGKDPRLAEPKRSKRAAIENQAHCQICWDGGEMYCCQGCPRSYHVDCLNKHFQGRAKAPNFYCPQHQCVDCEKKTAECGMLMYRCRWCERGYCEDCLDWDNVTLLSEGLPEYEMLNHEPTNAWFVECPACLSTWRKDVGEELRCKTEKKRIDREYAKFIAPETQYMPSFDGANDTPDTVSEAKTPPSLLDGVGSMNGKSNKFEKTLFDRFVALGSR